MSLASPPPTGTPIPSAIAEWADTFGCTVERLVRRSEQGAVTARLVAPGLSPLYAKWSPRDLLPEAERCSWLSSRHPSPRMVDYLELDEGRLLVTVGLPGENAVTPRWQAAPDVAAHAIGVGLAQLHTIDPSSCLFGAPEWVGIHDDIDVLVVAHGNPVAPNTIIGDDGSFIGHVGVGSLGVADRWADLAVASGSLEWGFGPGHERAFWDGYGIDPDPERIAHYRNLWARSSDG